MLTQSPTRSVVACAIFACVVAVTLVTNAQAQRPAGQQTPDKVVVSADEVLFDVVVRDKKGRLLTNLPPADFEVYEDGVRQGINSFRLAAPASAGTVGSSSTTAALYTDNKRDESVAGTTKTTEDR